MPLPSFPVRKIREVNYDLLPKAPCARFAVVSDLHDGSWRPVVRRLLDAEPDFVLCPGDILHDADAFENGLAFLRTLAQHLPVYVSLGNHELRLPDGAGGAIRATGAALLDGDFVIRDGLAIGGLSSGFTAPHTPGKPDLSFLPAFCGRPEPKILLCHHPEYFDPYLSALPLDLVISGHAHGGQWRILGIPLWAPGQGVFPKYARGLYGGRLLVTSGVGNHVPAPRLGNPAEIVLVTLGASPRAAEGGEKAKAKPENKGEPS